MRNVNCGKNGQLRGRCRLHSGGQSSHLVIDIRSQPFDIFVVGLTLNCIPLSADFHIDRINQAPPPWILRNNRGSPIRSRPFRSAPLHRFAPLPNAGPILPASSLVPALYVIRSARSHWFALAPALPRPIRVPATPTPPTSRVPCCSAQLCP